MTKAKSRRAAAIITLALIVAISAAFNDFAPDEPAPLPPHVVEQEAAQKGQVLASEALGGLAVKGRAPKTGYTRDQFGGGWRDAGSCDMRNLVLQRDLINATLQKDNCTVQAGLLQDPYTAGQVHFMRGPNTSQAVQIDHVVALSDAWQKGAQELSPAIRVQFANDPLNLLAVDGPANQQKGDGDAATWLPPNKPYRCPYVARQIAVKEKYMLWVTRAEHDAMRRILNTCPQQPLPIVGAAKEDSL